MPIQKYTLKYSFVLRNSSFVITQKRNLPWRCHTDPERRQAEEKLAKSEAKYRDLVDNAIVGVFTTTLDGRFLFVNNAMVSMYDFDSIEQMLAEGSLARWRDPERREHMLVELKKHGSVTNFDAETITRTGRHIQVIFSAQLRNDSISGMVMDITDRKQAVEEIARLAKFPSENPRPILRVLNDGTVKPKSSLGNC